MYAETDFLLALIKDDDWLGDAAESVYRDRRDELWTSQFTLIKRIRALKPRASARGYSARE